MIRTLTLAIAALLATHASASAQHWQPDAGTSFSIILSVAPKTVNTPAEVVDLDLFDTNASVVHTL